MAVVNSGIDIAELDPARRVQDDLFAHVNGRWVQRTPIPEDRGRYGSFDALREQAEADVRAIIEECAASQSPLGSQARKIGDLFTSFMDTHAVEAAGVEPLAGIFQQIDELASSVDVAALLGKLARDGVPGAIHLYVSADVRASECEILYLSQGGLGLPDESYYREEQHAAVLADYQQHVARIFAIAGLYLPSRAAESAQRVVALETKLAAAHLDNVADRDAVATYNKLSRAELIELAGPFDIASWGAWLGVTGPALDEVVVRQPQFIQALGRLIETECLEDWQDWMRREVLTTFAPYLNGQLVNENFRFYGKRLTGTPQLRERWKRGVALVESALGEAVGQLYVQRHYPPAAAERMEQLVGHLVSAFRETFQQLEWMSPQTQKEALGKLAAFRAKIGHPTTWKDFRALSISTSDLVGNVRRAAAVELDRQLAKIGCLVDRDEWLMTPQTVNAYYHPALNEIVFPAAILQPPFFDASADDAVNYGGIGAVIAHEIGHGFDDQGSRYDGTGMLRDWWTPGDRAAFEAKADALIEQFDALESVQVPGQFVNGALTVGENIGDLGGVTVGLRAYRLSVAASGGRAPVLDGMTGDQRFFLGWAQVWRASARPQEAQRLLSIDPHSPPEHRANIARNLTEFCDAFDVQPGDGMWLPENQRIRIF